MYKYEISIIIPAYNVEKYIKETLDSIFIQTFKNFEIIIIDDGSTDNTGVFAEEYKKKYMQNMKIVYQKNQGQSAARNNALKYIEGKYISFVDADDILEKDFFSKLYDACEMNNADMAICGYKKFISETKQIVYIRNPVNWDVQFNNKRHIFHYSPCGKLFRSSYIINYNFEFSVGEQLEDGPYGVMTHMLADNIIVLDYIGYNYRIHEDSVMGGIRKIDSRPVIPYKGIQAAVKLVRKHKNDEHTDQILSYCMIKILTGFTTNMCVNSDNITRKQICSYCYKLIEECSLKIKDNAYFKIYKLKKIPFHHKIAVKLFIIFYKMNLLYPFSWITSRIYRLYIYIN